MRAAASGRTAVHNFAALCALVRVCVFVRYSAQTDLPEPVGRPGAELKRTEEEEEEEEEVEEEVEE